MARKRHKKIPANSNLSTVLRLLEIPIAKNLLSQWKSTLSNTLKSLKTNSKTILEILETVNIDTHPNQNILREIQDIATFTSELVDYIESNIDYYSKFQNIINALNAYNQHYASLRNIIAQSQQPNVPHQNIINQLNNHLNNVRNNLNQVLIGLAVSGAFLDEHPIVKTSQIEEIRKRLKSLEEDLLKKNNEADEILQKTKDVVEKVTIGTIHEHIEKTLSKIEGEIPKLDEKIKKGGATFLVYCFIVLLITLKWFGVGTIIFITVKISLCLPPFLYLLHLLSVLRNKEKLREQYRHKELLARTFLALEETLKKYRTSLGDEISRELLQPILLKLYSDIEHSKDEGVYEALERITKIGKNLKDLGGQR